MRFPFARICGAVTRAALVLALAGTASGAGARGDDLALLPPVLGTSEFVAHDARSGLALAGYDPVAYLAAGEARPGRPSLELLWGGLPWRFASAANRAAFLRDPSAFLPRLGGHDAGAAASGRLASADPTLFLVRNGRVYLFRTAEGRTRFQRDPAAEAAAEIGWAHVRPELVAN